MKNITVCMCTWCEVRNVASQKFRLGQGPVFVQNSDSGSCSSKNPRLRWSPLRQSGSVITCGCFIAKVVQSVMESQDLVSVSKISSRSRRSRLGLEGLVSVSKDLGLGLELFVSRLCIGYFFMKFCKEFLKNGFKK